MAIDAVLYTKLSGTAGLTALVGARLYPGIGPQGVLAPFITWRRVSSVRYPAMGSDSGIISVRMQFDVVAATYASMRAIVEQLTLALSRWRDADASPAIIDCFLDNEFERVEPLADAVLHLASVDFILHHRET